MDQLLTVPDVTLKQILEKFEQDNKIVLERYRQGISYKAIAHEVGRSRGAVAGMVYRARKKGLLPDKPVNTTYQKGGRPKMAKSASPPKTVIRIPVVQVKKERIRLRLVESPHAVTFAELETHHCRWPSGDPKRSDFRFCGCRRVPNSPYCEEHTVMGTTPAFRRDRAIAKS